jgi:CheY-like chemotaxis protein
MAQERDALHSRHRILIVDDEPLVRTMFQRVLQHAGFDAIAATGGADGLRLLKHDPSIGLVMLDLMMPECDGWRFRHAQRTDARIAHIPTLIVTGSPLHHIVHDQLQATDYLLKPVSPDHLVSVVSSYCPRIEPFAVNAASVGSANVRHTCDRVAGNTSIAFQVATVLPSPHTPSPLQSRG